MSDHVTPPVIMFASNTVTYDDIVAFYKALPFDIRALNGDLIARSLEREADDHARSIPGGHDASGYAEYQRTGHYPLNLRWPDDPDELSLIGERVVEWAPGPLYRSMLDTLRWP